ncbi:MAG: polyphosphate kinase 1, partial [Verrucomicrobia bacterium]|nr:polyphosphate kinase 1 [Verrucomicrobiota bacterium]
IRYGIPEIFLHLPYNEFDSFAIKFTRDSELEFDDNFTESVYDKVSGGLLAREGGFPVRSNYDATIPPHFLRLLSKKLHISGSDSLYPGARYHNRKDLIDFPQLGRNDLLYPPPAKISPKGLKRIVKVGFFSALRKKDLLLHLPYHSFHTFIDFLRESSMDPLVQTIQITQYRLAKNSFVARALMAAAHNGKEVTVMVEPQARFDEGANIAWANEYQRNGVRVILGVQGLKVHSKLCLVTRREHGRLRHYTALGTGNFNELSAKVFSDHLLLTANQEMGEDAVAIFAFFERTYKPPKLKHLVAAPFHLRDFIKKRIQIEITNAREGLPAALSLKVNNLSDLETIELLYEAANAGVNVRLIVRGMFSLITGPDSPAPSIQAIGIVDKYLEHSRAFIFQNGNDPLVYLSSADLLPRNFDGRIETVFPILDSKLRKQLIEVFEIQWSDNVKARILSKTLSNRLRRPKAGEAEIRAQFVIEDYLSSLS